MCTCIKPFVLVNNPHPKNIQAIFGKSTRLIETYHIELATYIDPIRELSTAYLVTLCFPLPLWTDAKYLMRLKS